MLLCSELVDYISMLCSDDAVHLISHLMLDMMLVPVDMMLVLMDMMLVLMVLCRECWCYCVLVLYCVLVYSLVCAGRYNV